MTSLKASRSQPATGELTLLEEKRKKFMDDLMQVKNQREYAAMLKEIDSVKAQISEHEDAILRDLDEMEKLKDELATHKEHIETERKAVEKERAIAENELQNKIELSKREESLIEQRGANDRRKASERAAASRIDAVASVSPSGENATSWKKLARCSFWSCVRPRTSRRTM